MQRRLALALAISLPTASSAATYTVGSDPACTHASIQSAIDAASAGDIGDQIIVAAPLITEVELNLANDSVAIRGGFANCSDAAPTGRTRLVGRNDPASRVLAITNMGNRIAVDLVDVDVLREVGSVGGGISVSGFGPVVLTLTRSSVSGHNATRGAGIDLSGPLSGPKTLRLVDSLVSGNRSVTGGGVYCNPGAVELDVGGSISGNEAQFGGGLAGEFCWVRLVGDSTTRLGGNVALVDGGGAYLSYNSSVSASRSPGATSGPVIDHNIAGGRGGAMHFAASGGAVLTDAVVRGNRAGDSGGAIYGINSDLRFDRGIDPCEPDACRVIADNHAGTNPSTPGRGGVIALINYSFVSLVGQSITGNSSRAGAVVHASPGVSLWITDSLVTTSQGADELYWAGGKGFLHVAGSTIADNVGLLGISSKNMVSATIDGSILGDPVPLVAPGSNSEIPTYATCSILHPLTPPMTGESQVARIADPGFIDAASGQYELRDDAPAIDFCTTSSSSEFDRLGAERGFPYRGNPVLRFDAGAFERTALFANGLEGD